MSKLVNYAQEMLGEHDKFQGSYRGSLGHTFGHLVLSNEKLVFLREGGSGGAEFEMKFEIPYSNLNYEILGRNELKLSDSSGNDYTLSTAMMAKFIELKLKEFYPK